MLLHRQEDVVDGNHHVDAGGEELVRQLVFSITFLSMKLSFVAQRGKREKERERKSEVVFPWPENDPSFKLLVFKRADSSPSNRV